MIINFKNIACGGGKAPVVEALSVTANGTYTVPEGVDGYSPVDVNVPTGGEEKFRIQNGTHFEQIPAEFKVSDYNWEDMDNIYSVFPSSSSGLYKDLLEEYKKNRTKVKVIDIYDTVNDTLDFRGIDLSECYKIAIQLDCGKPFNLDFSGCDLSNLEWFEVFSLVDKGTLNVENCVWGHLVVFNTKCLVAGLESIDFSKCFLFPSFENQNPDLSNADFSNVRLGPGYEMNTSANFGNKQIEILDSPYVSIPDFEKIIDFSSFNLLNCSKLSITTGDSAEEVRGIGPLRSPGEIKIDARLSPSLKKVDFSGVDCLGSDCSYLLLNAGNVTDVIFPINIEDEISISSKVFTRESLVSLIDGLFDYGPDGGKTQRIGPENFSRLLPEDIDKAKAKGWTISEAEQ